MKMLENVRVTSAMLTSSVPEAAPAIWDSGTTFALTATASVAVAVGVDTGWTGVGQLDVYESLQAGNTNHAPASSPLWWKKVGTVYQEYNPATAYALADRVQVTADHVVYQSAVAPNTGNTPSTTMPDKWIMVGATNRMAMFDEKVGTQTQAPIEAKVSFMVPGRADSLALLNFDAASIRYRQIAPDSTVLRDETVDTVSDDGISDWFAYFTDDIVRKTDYAVEDLTLLAGCTIEVTLSAPGSIAKIGALVPGQFKELGVSAHGAELGFADYSKFIEDAWGNIEISERAYRKRGTFDVWIPANYVDEYQRQIALRRAKFTVFWGAAKYGSTLIYGFPKLGRTAITYPDYSISTLTLEGLAQQ